MLNSLEFGPETQRLLTLTPMLAGFETVMVCAAEVEATGAAKARLDGVSEMEPASPVPIRAMVCGPPATESLIETAALRVPEKCRGKSDGDRAGSGDGKAGTTGGCELKIGGLRAGEPNARDGEGCAAGIGESNGLRDADCTFVLIWESETVGG